MSIKYMFCFICSEQCIQIISSRKKSMACLFLYSRKLFLVTLPYFSRSGWGKLTPHILSKAYIRTSHGIA